MSDVVKAERLIPLRDAPFHKYTFTLELRCTGETRADAQQLLLEYVVGGARGRDVLDIDWVEVKWEEDGRRGEFGFKPHQ